MELWKNTKDSPLRRGALLLLEVSFFLNNTFHLLKTVGYIYSISIENDFVVIASIPSVRSAQSDEI